jgi:hypothetical protein
MPFYHGRPRGLRRKHQLGIIIIIVLARFERTFCTRREGKSVEEVMLGFLQHWVTPL